MLPEEVTKPLGEIGKKNPAMALVFAILLIASSVLWFSYSKAIKGSGDDKEKQLTDKDKQLEKKDLEIAFWKRQAYIKDSLYDDCGKQRYIDSKQTFMSVNRTEGLNDTIHKLVKKLKQ